MSVGLSTYDLSPSDFVHLAEAAEGAGFRSLWLGEHLFFPHGYASGHPTSGVSANVPLGGRPIIASSTQLVDPWVGLGAAAARTAVLQLCTGIYLAPLRHPLLTARAAHSLHQLSGGRLVLGLGSGWLREEFDALGVPFAERGRRLEETVEVLRALWRGGPVTYRGRHFAFDDVEVTPTPVRIPIVFGGNSDLALRRAARLGDGWMASGIPTFDEARLLRERIGLCLADHGARRPFEVYFRAPGADPDTPRRYRSEGIDNVILFSDDVFPDRDLSRAVDVLGEYGEAAGLRGSAA